jgi:hypothetical protein
VNDSAAITQFRSLVTDNKPLTYNPLAEASNNGEVRERYPPATRRKGTSTMSSQRRIDASKRNGARSGGPKTPAGKRRSSINATRHGLLAKCVVLDGESEPQFLLLLAQHQDKFAPRDDIEFGMIEDMAACYWRLRRAMAMEKCLLDEALDKSLDSDGIPNLGKAWDKVGDSPSCSTCTATRLC